MSAATLRSLHVAGAPLVLPNAWDAATGRLVLPHAWDAATARLVEQARGSPR